MANIVQVVGFMLGNEHYGLDIMGVEEIIRLVDITPVPRAPSFVEGIINLRGRIIPVVDLRKRLKMPTGGKDDTSRIIIMKVDTRRLGFIVDKVEEVLHIPEENVESAPGMSANNKYVDGVARINNKMVIILDVIKIFTPDEHMQLSKIK